MQFKAAVLRDQSNTSHFENVTLKDIRSDEVLVRLVASGVCHSDVTVQKNLYPIPRPIILGHEGSGVVERVGDRVEKVNVGDHVVLSFLSCGACPKCERDEPAYCDEFPLLNMSGLRADGTSAVEIDGQPVGAHFFGQSSFARYSVAHERNVVKVPQDAPLEMLGPFGCGIQTGAGAVFNVLRPRSGSSMVVVGAGGVGLSAVMAAVVCGCNPIIVLEPNPERRQVALDVGATHAMDPLGIDNLADHLQSLTCGGVDYALDATGIPDMISTVISAMGVRGEIGLVGIKVTDEKARFSVIEASSKGLMIRGITEGDSVPDRFINELIALFTSGRFPVDKLVDFYDFEDLELALEDQDSGKSIKPIVKIASY
jgi:aryl-alcohol dehydrogenase